MSQTQFELEERAGCERERQNRQRLNGLEGEKIQFKKTGRFME